MKTSAAERWIWGGFLLAVAAVIGGGVWMGLGRRSAPVGDGSRLPVLGTVPEFVLTERSGRTVSKADLSGTPWVANFIFTSCGGVCPLLSNRMAQLQRSLAAHGLGVRSVSFSVDPARDTPQVLRDYAARYNADEKNWLFLTGPRRELYGLISDGFHLAVAERSPEEAARYPDELITHSDRFVLVDAEGRIRAYYHGADAEVVAQVLRDATAL
jgi:protein SCO1/2